MGADSHKPHRTLKSEIIPSGKTPSPVSNAARSRPSAPSLLAALDAPVPAEWMKVLLDLTPDAELRVDFVYLFFDWAQSKSGEANAHAAMLSDRPALRTAYKEVCSEFVDGENETD